jgi:hypothetical protein
MNEIEVEATIEELRALAARLEALRHMEKAALELPGQQKHYATLLEDAYAALAQVETVVDELRQEVEYHHERLGEPVEPDDGEG